MFKERFKIIPSVYLMLIKKNEILLSRRYNTGFHDGEYGLPAGHLEGNETFIQAIIREAKEEIDIELDKTALKLIHVMDRKELTEERVDFFFEAKKWQGKPKIMEPNKCDDLRWFGLDNLPGNVIPYIRQVINSYLKGEFYSEYGWKN